jgi:formamidase
MLPSTGSEEVLTEVRDDYFSRRELAVPRRFFATTGIGVRKDGTNESEDLSLAARCST